MPRFSPQEDAVLLPYVARPADWRTIMARLPDRGLSTTRQRLVRLRREAGTLWRIDQSESARCQAIGERCARRERARSQPRTQGRFA